MNIGKIKNNKFIQLIIDNDLKSIILLRNFYKVFENGDDLVFLLETMYSDYFYEFDQTNKEFNQINIPVSGYLLNDYNKIKNIFEIPKNYENYKNLLLIREEFKYNEILNEYFENLINISPNYSFGKHHIDWIKNNMSRYNYFKLFYNEFKNVFKNSDLTIELLEESINEYSKNIYLKLKKIIQKENFERDDLIIYFNKNNILEKERMSILQEFNIISHLLLLKESG